MNEMMAAIEKEWTLRRAGVENVSTLYFGGGTPSLLQPEQLLPFARISDWEEFTLEANPEDITPEKCTQWREAGVTRLSIGVQTFDDKLLDWMNRKHTGSQAIQAIEFANAAGFEHISADLIYGLPGRTHDAWLDDLNTMLSLPIDHLSAYILTVEPRTLLGHRVAKGLEREADEDVVEDAYAALCQVTAAAGFDHYEVSNFARPGGRAVHNSRYWSGAAYVGLGPGAHGFDGIDTRYANLANNPLYIQSILKAESAQGLPSTEEVLSKRDRYNEMLMTGFRKAAGVDLVEMEKTWGLRPDLIDPKAWEQALENGLLLETGPMVRVAEESWLIGDSVAAQFFAIED